MSDARVLWLDETISDQYCPQLEIKLCPIINHICKFHDKNECEKYIKRASNEDRFVIIVNNQFARDFIPSIHSLNQVSSIYIYSKDDDTHDIQSQPAWIEQFPKVKSGPIQTNEIISQIKFEEPLTVNTFSTDTNMGMSTTGLNGNFVYYQLLIDCLLRMKTNQAHKNELIHILNDLYEGSHTQLKLIQEFQSNYFPADVLGWYSKDSFFYRTLNQALRLQNIHMLFLYHSYLSDIYQQLKRHQCKQSVHVYRSQFMSTKEFQIIEQQIKQYISINALFSTSTDLGIAFTYLGDDPPPDGFKKVLFEIDAHPNLIGTRPFADISPISRFRFESEILFMSGSIFRINQIEHHNNQNYATVRLSLCSDNEHELKELIEYLKQQNEEEQTNLSTFANILWKMGYLNLAYTYFSRFLDELPIDDPLRNSLYQDLADLTSQQGKYEESLEWHQKLVDAKEKQDDHNLDENEQNKSNRLWRKAKRFGFFLTFLTIIICSIFMLGVFIYVVRRGNLVHGERLWLLGDRYVGSLKNGKMSGQETLYYKNGNVYTGQFENDTQNGRGIFKWKDGGQYEGLFVNGRIHGNGTLNYANGDLYIGEFIKNKRNGSGFYTWTSGHRYNGPWKKDKKFGFGIFYYANGDIYMGHFLNDKLHGRGLVFYKNKDIFNGTWKFNKLHGRGITTLVNRDQFIVNYSRGKILGKVKIVFSQGMTYEGDYINGTIQGNGTLESQDGFKYTGEFKNNLLNGRGVLTSPNGDSYIGTFKDSKRHGSGIVHSANGNKFIGNFYHEKRNGNGTFIFANGGFDDGEWKDDKLHGYGRTQSNNGDLYIGQFINDQRHGNGTLYYRNGDIFIGQFIDGKRNGQGTLIAQNGTRFDGSWKDDLV